MSTRSSSDLCVRVKRSARLLVIVVAPFLVVGLALTVAIIPRSSGYLSRLFLVWSFAQPGAPGRCLKSADVNGGSL